MALLIEFILLLLFFQISGDCLLHVNQKLFHKQIETHSLVEQFTHSLIFGILLNSVFVLIEVYFIPFNLLILIVFNIFILLFTITLNRFSLGGFFYLRLLQKIKNRRNLNQNSKKGLIILLIYFLFIIIIINFFQNSQKLLDFNQNVDIYVYIHHSLDAIRNGWNFYDPNYLGAFYSTKLFTFFLIPFISLDPTKWEIIISQYLLGLQFILLFLLVYSICKHINQKPSFIVFLVYLAGYYLATWFFYFLPSNWNLLLILMLSQYLFDEKLKSSFLSIILVFFGLFLHFSTILMFGIPFLITYIIMFIQNPNSFGFYKGLKKLHQNNMKLFYILLFFVLVLIFALIIALIPNIISFWDLYSSFKTTLRNVEIRIWEISSIGFFLITIIYILILKSKPLRNRKSIINTSGRYIYILFIVLNIYITLYLSNVEFWGNIIHSEYFPYRFFIYHNFSYLLLIPFSISSIPSKNNNFSYHINRIKNKIFSKFKKILIKTRISFKFLSTLRYSNFKNEIKKKISLRYFIFIIIMISLTPKIIANVENDFIFMQFSRYLPDGYIDTLEPFNGQDLQNKTYFYNPKPNIGTVNWNLFHTYLGDARCIDLDEIKIYLNENLYSEENNNSFSEYQNFKDYLFNSTKSIYSYAAVYKNLPENMKTCVNIDFIFLDTYTNPNLVNYMLNDPEYFSVFSNLTSKFFGNKYTVYNFIPQNFL